MVDAFMSASILDNRMEPALLKQLALICMVCSSALFFAPRQVSAQSESFSVQELLGFCERDSSDGEGLFCVGIFYGIQSMMILNCSLLNDGVAVPDHLAAEAATTGAAVQGFLNWARNNPQRWGEEATFGAITSISETFPCTG